MMDAQQYRIWRRRRSAYYAGLVVLFAAIALYFGPNVFMFGTLTWVTPAYFVPTVERSGVPLVRAMKEFQRDHGRLPDRIEDLIPRYLPSEWSRPAYIDSGQFVAYGPFNHSITYDFNPATEGWSVSGVYTSGRIPVPPVTVAPATAPTTAPTTVPAAAPAIRPA